MSTNGIDRCDELQPQLAAYALGEAEPDSELLTHLARCADCWRTLHSYAQIARTLPYTAPQIAPSPELRQRILAAATATASKAAGPQRRKWWSLTWPRWELGRAMRWGVAFAALLVLLGWNAVLQTRLNTQTAQLQRLTTQVAASRESWRTMTRVLNTSDLQAYELSGSVATGQFWASPQLDVACLVAEGLPDPGVGNVYQVWLLQGNTRVAAGSFVPQAGSGWVLLRIEQPLAAYQEVDVTVEPRTGSQAPSGKEILKGVIQVSAQTSSLFDRETTPFTSYPNLVD